MRWASLLALLVGAACNQTFLEVPASIEWIAWVEVSEDGVENASPLMPVGDPRAWAVESDRVTFVGFEGLGDPLPPGADEARLRGALPCELSLRPAWPPGLAVPRLSADWAVDLCEHPALDRPECSSCNSTCGLMKTTHSVAFEGVQTDVRFFDVVEVSATRLLATLRRLDRTPGVDAEYLVTIDRESEVLKTSHVKLPGLSHSIAFDGADVFVGAGGQVHKLDAARTATINTIPLPDAAPPELELVGTPAAGVFAFYLRGPAYRIGETATQLMDVGNNFFDLAIDAGSGALALLSDPFITLCEDIGCLQFTVPGESLPIGLPDRDRPRIALVEGELYFGLIDQPVQRREGSKWIALGWPSASGQPFAFAAFAGGLLIGGRREERGLLYFERGEERCTFDVGSPINDLIVLDGGKTVYAVGDSPLEIVELTSP